MRGKGTSTRLGLLAIATVSLLRALHHGRSRIEDPHEWTTHLLPVHTTGCRETTHPSRSAYPGSLIKSECSPKEDFPGAAAWCLVQPERHGNPLGPRSKPRALGPRSMTLTLTLALTLTESPFKGHTRSSYPIIHVSRLLGSQGSVIEICCPQAQRTVTGQSIDRRTNTQRTKISRPAQLQRPTRKSSPQKAEPINPFMGTGHARKLVIRFRSTRTPSSHGIFHSARSTCTDHCRRRIYHRKPVCEYFVLRRYLETIQTWLCAHHRAKILELCERPNRSSHLHTAHLTTTSSLFHPLFLLPACQISLAVRSHYAFTSMSGSCSRCVYFEKEIRSGLLRT